MVCKKIEVCDAPVTYNEFIDLCHDDDGHLEPWCPLNKSRELLSSPQEWLKDEEEEAEA